MRRIRIFEHISLDGVISPGSDDDRSDHAQGGWTAPYRSPAGAQILSETQGECFDLLLGRRTYDQWSAYWPNMRGGPFAERLNGATKYVATHRPQGLAWGPVEHLGDDALAGVRRVKATAGPDLIVWGSSTLTSALLDDGLVDEVVLLVYPVLLGAGKRAFSDRASPRELALVDSRASPTGVLVNTYRHLGALRAATP